MPHHNSNSMPELNVNIEGSGTRSRVYSTLLIEAGRPLEEQKWRAWLTYCSVKVGHDYTPVHALVQAQPAEVHVATLALEQGHDLPIPNLPVEMDDCITSLQKATQCPNKPATTEPSQPDVLKLPQRQTLNDFLHEVEHRQQQLPSGRPGDSLVLISVTPDGAGIILRSLKMAFKAKQSAPANLFGRPHHYTWPVG